MNKAVAHMDRVIQADAARTEELSATAQNLAAQGTQLTALVARFHIEADGGTGRPSPAKVVPARPPSPAKRGAAPAAVGVPVAAGHGHGKPDGFEEF